MLGQKEAIMPLAAIYARHAAGKVHSPSGLLRRMVEQRRHLPGLKAKYPGYILIGRDP